MNCSPRCTCASLAVSASISQETTSGGSRLKAATARSNAGASAYLGCWAAWRPCQVAGCQLVKAGVFDMARMLALYANPSQNAAPSPIEHWYGNRDSNFEAPQQAARIPGTWEHQCRRLVR